MWRLPAEALVGGLLVRSHGVHELQARPLVVRAQQRAAVGVDLPHALQRAEERVADGLLLRQGQSAGFADDVPVLGDV